MNGFDLSEASDIRLGSNTINALYYGPTLLWPSKRDYSKEYLTINALIDSTVVFLKYSDNISRTIQYSKNKHTWNTISFGNFSDKDIPESYKVSLLAGEKLYLKGSNSAYCTNDGANYCSININEGLVNIYGNIMSLIYDDNFYGKTVLTEPYSFSNLFKRELNMNQYIKDASNLILPATTLASYCYKNMFSGCRLLKSAPELPATTLAEGCYSYMFWFCGLLKAPDLPAPTLKYRCYEGMFGGCTSLTSPPELSATTLSRFCYASMFSNCTSLTSAPELSVTTLDIYCYASMFGDCTSLTSAPELPATTLADRCYSSMFESCQSLSYIKCLATDIHALNSLTYWLKGVSSTGTFVKNPNMSNWPTGDSGIPSGWIVQDAS